MVVMKRIIAILLLVTVQSAVLAGKTPSRTQLSSFISEYRGCEGVELVQLGSLATSALKTAIRMAAKEDDDPDLRHALSMLKGIRRLTVFEFEDAAPALKEKMNLRLARILDKSELLFEAKDGGDSFSMYGVIDDKAGTASDFVMYSPESCALICIFGKVSVDALSKLMENHD